MIHELRPITSQPQAYKNTEFYAVKHGLQYGQDRKVDGIAQLYQWYGADKLSATGLFRLAQSPQQRSSTALAAPYPIT
jgi:hypothetical protein